MRVLKMSCLGLALLALSFGALGAQAGEDTPGQQYEFEIHLYQALTNVTGNGLTSRTLPGIEGWLQIIHEKLDNVDLVMEGDTLTWNGKCAPENPRIMLLSSPSVMMLDGEKASIMIGSENRLQYMARREDNLFELHSLAESKPESIGLSMSLLPRRAKDAALLDCDLVFRYTWIKEREKIEGVGLEVGKPVVGRQTVEGAVQLRLGEWSCYSTTVDSQGSMYLFMKAVEKAQDAAAGK